jgi:hypothetical protein
MKRSYETKIRNVNDWITITNYHWDRLKGIYDNDAEAWGDTFHSMETQDWWDIVECHKILSLQYPWEHDRYRNLASDMKVVEERLMFGKPVIKAMVKQYNLQAFRAWMTFKDFFNDITGQPTKQWRTKEDKVVRIDFTEREIKKIANFQNLFE